MQQPATVHAPSALWRAAPFVFVLLWSGGFVFGKLGLAYSEPMTMLALRYGLAVAVLVPLAMIRRPLWPVAAGHWAALVLTGILIQGVYFGLAYLAMKRGMNAGTTAIIMSLQPALVAALTPLLGGRRSGPLLWLGLAVGMAGVVLAIWSEGSLGPSPWGHHFWRWGPWRESAPPPCSRNGTASGPIRSQAALCNTSWVSSCWPPWRR
ncbi:DMT family transporter [Gemmobacter lanyuensis]